MSWTFAAKLAEDPKLSQIPFVVVSAFENIAQNLQAKNVFKKPVNLKVLFDVIKTWCASEGVSHG